MAADAAGSETTLLRVGTRTGMTTIGTTRQNVAFGKSPHDEDPPPPGEQGESSMGLYHVPAACLLFLELVSDCAIIFLLLSQDGCTLPKRDSQMQGQTSGFKKSQFGVSQPGALALFEKCTAGSWLEPAAVQ